MKTIALHFQHDQIQVAAGGTVTTFSPLFHPDSTQGAVKLKVKNDGMDITLIGRDVERTTVDSVLSNLFEKIRGFEKNRGTTAPSDQIVIVGAENPDLEKIARTAGGFKRVDFISPVDAALRGARLTAGGTYTDQATAVLFCRGDGIEWVFTEMDDKGDLILNGRDHYRRPKAKTSLDVGFGRFLQSLLKQERPIHHILVTGEKAEAVTPFLAAIAHYSYEVRTEADAVILGAVLPPLQSKYAAFDALIQDAVDLVEKDSVEKAEFAAALAHYLNAKNLFETPQAVIQQTTEQLRCQIRLAILNRLTLSGGSKYLSSFKNPSVSELKDLSEMAISLSETDAERAAVYERMIAVFRRAGMSDDAETAAITAAFFDPDPDNEKHYMDMLRKK